MVEKDYLGGNNQWRAEGKKMPVLVWKATVEAKIEGSVVSGREQYDVTEIFDRSPKTTVVKQFHGICANLRSLAQP
jgi:hypothetical protein